MKDYIIFDLEWNQSPQGKENSIEKLPFEIIEIGAVKLNHEFQMISEFHKLILPQVYGQLHYKISEVTHMDMSKLQREGENFQEVISEFISWCGEDVMFGTWGSMDLTELQRNMAYYQMENPFGTPLFYYDIQKLYALWRGDVSERISLDAAVEELGLLEGRPFHQALDDAYYTGKVLQAMEFDRVKPYYSIDYYQLPQSQKEEIYLEFPNYAKYVSRVFETKEDALADKTVTDMICHRCKRMLRKKIRWFSFNQKIYFCLAVCPEHGYVRGKIRIKKAGDTGVFVIKTMTPTDNESAQNIYDKKEELKKRRREKNRIKRAGRNHNPT